SLYLYSIFPPINMLIPGRTGSTSYAKMTRMLIFPILPCLETFVCRSHARNNPIDSIVSLHLLSAADTLISLLICLSHLLSHLHDHKTAFENHNYTAFEWNQYTRKWTLPS